MAPALVSVCPGLLRAVRTRCLQGRHRCWLLLRNLDTDHSGELGWAAAPDYPSGLMGASTTYHRLRCGGGTFWTKTRSAHLGKTLRLMGAIKVSQVLGVEVEEPRACRVKLPLDLLEGPAREWRSALRAAPIKPVV